MTTGCVKGSNWGNDLLRFEPFAIVGIKCMVRFIAFILPKINSLLINKQPKPAIL
jgi:hypothetical protein